MISGWGLHGVGRVFLVLFIFLRLVPRFLCCFGLPVGWASSVMILCYCFVFSGMRLDVIILQHTLCPTLVLLVFAMDCPGRVGGLFDMVALLRLQYINRGNPHAFNV